MKFKKNFIGQDGFQWWIGVVEDRDDPEKLGRCRVRVFGVHTDDLIAIPTEDLPWAISIYSVNNNDSFAAPKEGEYVFGFFLDGSFCQSPAILGVIPGINQQLAPVVKGFGDLRSSKKIKSSPKKPISIDYPEAPSGQVDTISGNIINDAVGVERVARDNIIIHVPLSRAARPSYIEENLFIVGYNHKFTSQELKKGHIDLLTGELVPILGINGADTEITEAQARVLLNLDIIAAIDAARSSIGEEGWSGLNVAQKAGLTLTAYNLGTQVNFEKDGIRSAVTSGDVVRAAQLLSTTALRSLNGKYLHSENILSHAAATLFKSIPKTEILTERADVTKTRNPVSVSGAGIGVQVHETDISTDDNADSLKYPLQEDIGKPSISDLATKLGKTTLQRYRERSVISANGAFGESWSEPAPAYAAEYPHNKVKETESGHIFEMDDTPGFERVHLAHRSGSFTEFYPSGSKVEKIVKNNYRIVMSDDHLYVAGKVNIVIESNAHIKVVGDCFLQVENNLEASVSGNMNVAISGGFNVKANTLHFDIANTSTITANNQYISIDDKLVINSNTSNITTANDLTVFSAANQYYTTANTVYHKSKNIKIESSADVSINSAGVGYFTTAGILNLKSGSTRITGSTVDVDGTLNATTTNMKATGADSNGDTHLLTVAGVGANAAANAYASVSSNSAIDANAVIDLYYSSKKNLDEIAETLKITVKQVEEVLDASSYLIKSIKKGTPTAAQKYLEPDKLVRLSEEINIENNRRLANYLANPENYRSVYSNAKRLMPPILSSGSDLILKNQVGEDLIVINDSADITKWFEKQLLLAANGYWRESGVDLKSKRQPSNPNILSLWRNLGFMNEPWNMSDQSNWAIAFVNLGLKQNGYRYFQTPNPKDVEIRIVDYRFSRINPVDAQPGDVVLWNNDHVNFVYKNINGNLTYIGGSQQPDPRFDVADTRVGDVSVVGSGGAQIVTILRPSKT